MIKLTQFLEINEENKMEQTIKTYEIKQNGEVKLMACPEDIKINPMK